MLFSISASLWVIGLVHCVHLTNDDSSNQKRNIQKAIWLLNHVAIVRVLNQGIGSFQVIAQLVWAGVFLTALLIFDIKLIFRPIRKQQCLRRLVFVQLSGKPEYWNYCIWGKKQGKKVKRFKWTGNNLTKQLETSISCRGLVNSTDLPGKWVVSSVADQWPAVTVHGSTAGMVLTLLFLLILRSGRGLGSLVWISSSGVLPSGGSSLFLLFLVSGNHWGGSSKGPKPNWVESSASVGVAGATWDEDA